MYVDARPRPYISGWDQVPSIHHRQHLEEHQIIAVVRELIAYSNLMLLTSLKYHSNSFIVLVTKCLWMMHMKVTSKFHTNITLYIHGTVHRLF